MIILPCSWLDCHWRLLNMLYKFCWGIYYVWNMEWYSSEKLNILSIFILPHVLWNTPSWLLEKSPAMMLAEIFLKWSEYVLNNINNFAIFFFHFWNLLKVILILYYQIIIKDILLKILHSSYEKGHESILNEINHFNFTDCTVSIWPLLFLLN